MIWVTADLSLEMMEAKKGTTFLKFWRMNQSSLSMNQSSLNQSSMSTKVIHPEKNIL